MPKVRNSAIDPAKADRPREHAPKRKENPPGTTRPATSRPSKPKLTESGSRVRTSNAVSEYRNKQVCVAKIIEKAFGEPNQCPPDQWELRTYLMLVGMIYERLVVDEQAMPTSRLAALARLLAEQRRARVSSPKATADSGPSQSNDAAVLSGTVTDAVRQIYGTNLIED